MIYVQKVMCVKCGSIGYTASPQYVNCSECGGAHRVIGMDCKDSRHVEGAMLSLFGTKMERGDKDASIDITFK